MARSIWTGALSFGLVNVPVKLFSAIDEKDVHFHQFQDGTGERIRNRRVAEGSGEEVPYEDIVKGYEVRKGEYVMLTPEELEAVEPERSRTIDLEDFVDLDEIDPIYFQRTYYLAPANDAAAKAFALLRTAMSDANRAGIARFVMRDKEYLAAVRPMKAAKDGGLLVVDTMYFADEVRDPAEIAKSGGVGGRKRPAERERRMAEQLIESLSRGWDPGRYRDSYRERLLKLVKTKARGDEVVVEEPPEPAPVLDLMSALEASVRDAGGRGRGRERRRGGERRRRGRGRGERRRGRGERAGDGRRLTALSREELYEQAQQRRIAGRSRMSKDELIDALRQAS
jgi:DNA end-binding protein Ku